VRQKQEQPLVNQNAGAVVSGRMLSQLGTVFAEVRNNVKNADKHDKPGVQWQIPLGVLEQTPALEKSIRESLPC
jgi:hypothetical protein